MGLQGELNRGMMQMMQMGTQMLMRVSMMPGTQQTMKDVMQGGKEFAQQVPQQFEKFTQTAHQNFEQFQQTTHQQFEQFTGGASPEPTGGGEAEAMPPLPPVPVPQPADEEMYVVDEVPHHDHQGIPATQLTDAEFQELGQMLNERGVDFHAERHENGGITVTFAAQSSEDLAYGLHATSQVMSARTLDKDSLVDENEAVQQDPDLVAQHPEHPDLHLDPYVLTR